MKLKHSRLFDKLGIAACCLIGTLSSAGISYGDQRGSLPLLLAQQSAEYQPSAEPKIVSRSVFNGRGIPYGGSVTPAPVDLEVTSTDPRYGREPGNAIKVGGGIGPGPQNEVRYLSSLRGPNGEPIVFERLGACCQFATRNSPHGGGLIDVYLVIWKGQSNPIRLYLNMYDPGDLLVPMGFASGVVPGQTDSVASDEGR